MQRNRLHKTANQGFVLITGLIFLVVVTLLALSTMGSTTLQEKMASNLREQSRALEGADAALRDGEARLADFVEYAPVGGDYSYDPTPDNTSNGDELDWHLWRLNKPLINAKNDEGFLDPTVWGLAADGTPLTNIGADDPQPSSYGPPFDGSLSAPPQVYIEETKNILPDDLNPDTAARGRGSFIYRVTGRAQGGHPSAVAITQSQYLKRY